tara:strand:- start:2794 stop:3033 length:240 start_codon:yes stop_codon:yes gene_type:complete
MNYEDFLNIDQKILVRDKKLFDYINEQIQINQSIFCEPHNNNEDLRIAGTKCEAYSDIYYKLLDLTNEQFKQINEEPNQ